jgi:ACS family glucarate transporter-like MFS transporter
VRSAVIILMLVRFGLGAGEATMYPATSLFVERWFPVQERGKANGLIFGGVGIGSGLTPPLVTAIMLHYGWRASFWFSAAVGLLVGLVWYIAARDTPDAHPMVGDEERKLIDGGRFLTAAAAQTPAKQKIPWSLIFTSRATLALTLSYFSFGYIAWIFFGWFFIYMAQVRGLNLKASALYSMLPFIAMTAGCLLGGVLSDWLARIYSLRVGRCLLSSVCLAITAVFMILGSRAHSPVVAGVVLACGAGALYISQSSYWAVSADIAGEYVSVVSGMMNMGGQIGGAITASLTPLIASYFGWEVSFVAAAVIALAGALAWLAIDPRRDVLIVR